MTPESNELKGDQGSSALLDQALATLIACTHSKKRPHSLPEIARQLDIAVSELGSISEVADRIGISTKMLRQFSNVSRLSKPVLRLFEARQLDSVDAATHLLALSADDQLKVAQALAQNEINTIDLRAITELRRKKQGGPITAIIETVRRSKTTQQYVIEFVIRGGLTKNELSRIFMKHLSPSNIIGVEVSGALGQLILSREGLYELYAAAKKLGVTRRQVIQELIAESESR